MHGMGMFPSNRTDFLIVTKISAKWEKEMVKTAESLSFFILIGHLPAWPAENEPNY